MNSDVSQQGSLTIEEINLLFSLTLLKQTLELQILQSLTNSLTPRNLVAQQISYPNESLVKKEEVFNVRQTAKASQNSVQSSERINSIKKRQLPRNDSKNIPRNFGKAIIIFIQKNEDLVKKVLIDYDIDYLEYRQKLVERKKQMNGIVQLKSIWLDSEFEYAKVTRILSLFFMKRKALPYIFKSKSDYYLNHIKYRRAFFKILENPEQFIGVKNIC